MSDAELLTTVARLRRAMPRNGDVLTVCDALEHSLMSRDNGLAEHASRDTVAAAEPVSRDTVAECPRCAGLRAQAVERQRKHRANAKVLSNGAPPS